MTRIHQAISYPHLSAPKKMKNKVHLIKSAASSEQLIREKESVNEYGMVTPMISPPQLLGLYYSNVYHRRSINLVAGMLSQLRSHDLDGKISDSIHPTEFVRSIAIDLLIYGNAYIEETSGKWYWLPGHEGRVKKDHSILQYTGSGQGKPLDGHHFRRHSPSSRFYGEPDYLAAANAIQFTSMADQYNLKFFENGAKPELAMIFEGDEPSEEQARKFADFLSGNFKGLDNARKTLVVGTAAENSKIRFEQLSKIEDMSFEKLKKVARDEIVAAHGVPPRLVGIIEARKCI